MGGGVADKPVIDQGKGGVRGEAAAIIGVVAEEVGGGDGERDRLVAGHEKAAALGIGAVGSKGRRAHDSGRIGHHATAPAFGGVAVEEDAGERDASAATEIETAAPLFRAVGDFGAGMVALEAAAVDLGNAAVDM